MTFLNHYAGIISILTGMLYMLAGISGYRDKFFTLLVGCLYVVTGVVGVVFSTYLISSIFILTASFLSFRLILRGKRLRRVRKIDKPGSPILVETEPGEF